jgi:hypothetical protein
MFTTFLCVGHLPQPAQDVLGVKGMVSNQMLVAKKTAVSVMRVAVRHSSLVTTTRHLAPNP